MRTLIIFLFPLITAAQSYIGLNGGIQELTDTKPAFSAYLHHDIGKVGARAYYMFRENGVKDDDTFGLQATFKPVRGTFYTPTALFGMDVTRGEYRPSYGVENLFRLQDNVHISLGYLQIDEISYTSLGVVLKIIPVEKGFRPRFF